MSILLHLMFICFRKMAKTLLISILTNCHTFDALKPQDLLVLLCSYGSQNGSHWAKIKILEVLHSF